MPYVFTSKTTLNNVMAINGAYSNLYVTALTGLTAISTAAGQIVVFWSGGLGNNVKYSYVLSSGTIQSVRGTSSPVTLTLTTDNSVTTTVTVTATVLGGSASVVSTSITSVVPPPTDSMLFWYRFKPTDYTSSTIANYAPYNNNAIVSYSATTACSIDATNVIKGAGSLLVNSSTNSLNLGSFTIANNTGFTVSWWYKSASGYVPIAYDILFDFTNGGNYNYICASDGGSPSPYNLMFVNGTGNAFWLYVYVNIFDTNWHHVVITNQSTGGWAVYIDNVKYQAGSSAWHSQHTVTVDNTQVFAGNTGTTFTIGKDALGSDSSALGDYADVRVYTRGVSTAEVNLLYNYYGIPFPTTNLVCNFSSLIGTSTTTNEASLATWTDARTGRVAIGTGAIYSTTTTIKSKPTVLGYMQLTYGNRTTPQNSWTFYYVCYFTSAGDMTSSEGNNAMAIVFNNNNLCTLYQNVAFNFGASNNSGGAQSTWTPTVGTNYIFAITCSGSVPNGTSSTQTYTYRINGVDYTPASNTESGRFYYINNPHFNCGNNTGEISFYVECHSLATVQTMEQYLSYKWGIGIGAPSTIAISSPYSN